MKTTTMIPGEGKGVSAITIRDGAGDMKQRLRDCYG